MKKPRKLRRIFRKFKKKINSPFGLEITGTVGTGKCKSGFDLISLTEMREESEFFRAMYDREDTSRLAIKGSPILFYTTNGDFEAEMAEIREKSNRRILSGVINFNQLKK